VPTQDEVTLSSITVWAEPTPVGFEGFLELSIVTSSGAYDVYRFPLPDADLADLADEAQAAALTLWRGQRPGWSDDGQRRVWSD
jgi:hypothetical protein